MTNTILTGHKWGVYVGTGNVVMLQGTLWNNVFDLLGSGTIVTGTVNYWGDPAFVNAAAGDYHLGFGSAAIDRGVNAGVATDIDGEARPMGMGYDIGADETEGLDLPNKLYLPLVLRSSTG